MEIGWQLGLILYQTYTNHLICGAKARDRIKICIEALEVTSAWKPPIFSECERKKDTLAEAGGVTGFRRSRFMFAAQGLPFVPAGRTCTLPASVRVRNKHANYCYSWFLWWVDVKMTEILPWKFFFFFKNNKNNPLHLGKIFFLSNY